MRETSASGSWKPEDSANTYANIDSKLRESNYNIQVTPLGMRYPGFRNHISFHGVHD